MFLRSKKPFAFYLIVFLNCCFLPSLSTPAHAGFLTSRVILRQTLPTAPQEVRLRLLLPSEAGQESTWARLKESPWQKITPLAQANPRQDAAEVTLLQVHPASLPATLSAYTMAELWKAGPFAYYGQAIEPNDLAYSPLIQPNETLIHKQAKALVSPDMNPLQAMTALKNWLQQNIKLTPANETLPIWEQATQQPLVTLNCKQGNALEQALLFASMARAVALPTRLAVGFTYRAPQQLHGLASLVPQVWNEVALASPKVNQATAYWLPLDVTSPNLWLQATHLKLDSLNGAQNKLPQQLGNVFKPFMGKMQADLLYGKGSDNTRLFEGVQNLSSGLTQETSEGLPLVASAVLPSVVQLDLTSKPAINSTQGAISFVDLDPQPAEWNNPNSVAGQLRLGLEALSMGDAKRAYRYWQQAAELSNTPYLQYRTGVILLGFKAYDLADALLKQAESHSADLAPLSQTLRQELLGQPPVQSEQMLALLQVQANVNKAFRGDISIDESLTAVKALKQTYPDWLPAYLLEGELLQQTGQAKQALLAYNATIAHFPQWPEPLFYKAQLLKEQQQLPQAEQAYLKAYQAAKTYKAPMLQTLAYTALTEAKLLKQISHLKKAPQKAEGWYALAEALEAANRPDAALDALQQGLQANPKHPLLLAFTLRLLAEAGRLPEATDVYRQLSKYQKESTPIRVACLRYTSLLRLKPEAQSLAMSLLNSKAASTPSVALALGQWAVQNQQAGVFQQVLVSALPCFKQQLTGAVSSSVAFSNAYQLAALAFTQQGKLKPESLALVKRYTELLQQAQPSHTGTLRLKAQIALKEKNLAEAERALQLAIGLEPKQAEALLLMAELELARNNWPEAYNWTALALELDPAYPEATMLAVNFSQKYHAPALTNKTLWRLTPDEEALLRQYLLQNKLWQEDSTWLASVINQQWLAAEPKNRLVLEETRIQLLNGLNTYKQRLQATYNQASERLSHPPKRVLPLFVMQTVRLRSQLALLQQLQQAITLWQNNESYLYYVAAIAQSLQSLEGLEQKSQQQLERLPISSSTWQSLSLQAQTENPTQAESAVALAYHQMREQCLKTLKTDESNKKKQENANLRRFVN